MKKYKMKGEIGMYLKFKDEKCQVINKSFKEGKNGKFATLRVLSKYDCVISAITFDEEIIAELELMDAKDYKGDKCLYNVLITCNQRDGRDNFNIKTCGK